MRQFKRIWVELLLAAVLTALGLLITLQPDDGNGRTAIDSFTVLTVTLPVLWFRRAPLGAASGIALGMVLSGIPTFDQTRCGVAIPAALLILFSLASMRERDEALAGLAAVVAGLVFLLFTDPQLDIGAVFFVPLSIGVWGAGRVARERGRKGAELADRTRVLEETREETSRLAVDVEKARLASELDVEARAHLGVVAELASAGEQDSNRSPAESRAAFQRIENEGRESLNGIRDLLGVLRSDEMDTSPRPTLEQLEPLLGLARIGGEVVGLEVEGQRRPLPGSVEFAAYRMIQLVLGAFAEADEGPASVRLSYREASLDLEVRGSLSAETPVIRFKTARERVSANGGTFDYRPEDSGRLLVVARLPVGGAGA